MTWGRCNGRHSYGWMGRGGGGAVVYHFGWPVAGSSESNVACAFAGGHGLGSASDGGNMVDAVGSVEIGKVGAPTYDVVATGDWGQTTPGVTFTNTAYFQKAGGDACFNIGTSNATVEFLYKTTVSGNDKEIFWHGVSSGYYCQMVTLPANQFNLGTKGTAGTSVVFAAAAPANWKDGDIHKFRWVMTRAGNQEAFFDGLSLGTGSMATVNGSSLNPDIACFGNYTGGGYSFSGTLFEWRLSLNATNNSGGPNGG
jgi:hypothetical protein